MTQSAQCLRIGIAALAFLSAALSKIDTFAVSLSQTTINFDSENSPIDRSNVSADGNIIALTGKHRIVLYKLGQDNKAVQIDTHHIHETILKDDFIPTRHCETISQCRLFALSADGRTFGFVTAFHQLLKEKFGGFYLYSITEKGIDFIPLPEADFAYVTDVSKLSISEDGQIVLVVTDRGVRLYRVNPESKQISALYLPKNIYEDLNSFSISPNGRYLTASGNKPSATSPISLYLFKIEDMNITRVGIDYALMCPAAKFSGANVSNDGNTMTFNCSSHIFRVAVKTAGPLPVSFILPTEAKGSGTANIKLSDDGKFVYSKNQGLFTVHENGVTQLMTPENASFYKFSNDNEKIFVFENSPAASLPGYYNLYQLNSDHTFESLNTAALQDDTGFPTLSDDGHTFVTLREHGLQVNQAVVYRMPKENEETVIQPPPESQPTSTSTSISTSTSTSKSKYKKSHPQSHKKNTQTKHKGAAVKPREDTRLSNF